MDTHTYLLRAPLADPARWRNEVDRKAREHPRYARYANLERASLANSGTYRCSAGLVSDALRDRRSHTTLGEANGATRAELREQVNSEGLADVLITDDCVAALHQARVSDGSALLIHIDPFSLSSALWERIAPALDTMCARSEPVILLVYRYTRSGRSPWPVAPTGTLGPFAQTRGGSHELAAYASAPVSRAASETCTALGWTLEPQRQRTVARSTTKPW